MSDDLDSLRPHPNTGDEAPVSYRAKHIRRLFAEIERLNGIIGVLSTHHQEMADLNGRYVDLTSKLLDGERL